MGNSNKDNYTPVPNDLLEALCWYKDMTNLQRRIVLYIIRKTYGWNKDSDIISIRNMAVEIGATRAKTSLAVSDLRKSNIVMVEPAPNGKAKRMKVLPVENWDKPVSRREHVPNRAQNLFHRRNSPCSLEVTKPVPNREHTKERNTLIQKKEKKASPFSDYELTPEEIAEGWEA